MQKEIFLLDDDLDEHEIFQSALKRINADLAFIKASSWQEAAVILSSQVPDFIFVDLNMPKMDGFSCVTEIRKISAFDNTPIYIYSTGITEKEGRKALSFGATDYIVKPASFIELCKLLKKIIYNPA